MTFPEFKKLVDDFYKHTAWRHGPADLTVEQSWDQLNEFVRTYWPQDVVFCDENLKIIVDGCLWNTSLMSASELLKAARACRDSLRKHTPPQPAPVIAEPPAPQPKMSGADSLGSGAESVEHPISSVVQRADEAAEGNHAFEDAYNYWDRTGYRNKLHELRQKAWDEAPIVNGLRNKAAIEKRFKELKNELDKSLEVPKDNAHLQEVADEARGAAMRNGITDSTEILRRVEQAVREAARRKP